MTEWTSIAVKEETKERFNELKDDESADELLTDLLDSYNGKSVGDLEPFGGEVPEIDTEGIAAAIVDEMEASKGVTIEQVEISEGQSMDRDDVENIVESWVERNLDRLKRGTL